MEMDQDNFDTFKIILWIILFLVFGIIIITCKPVSENYIMTVNGPADPEEIGHSLTHEHILVDFIGADSTGFHRWNRDTVIAKTIPYLEEIKEYGINTIFECTPEYLGRDPLLLKSMSDITGMNIITNTGLYGAHYYRFLPSGFYTTDAESLAQEWTREFLNGIDDTGIRPGFIKIGVNPDDTLSDYDTRLTEAAAITHMNTGLVIASHTGPDKPALAQLEILKQAGVDPSAFIWVHANRGTLETNIKAAKTGVWISLDNINAQTERAPGTPNTVEWYADRIIRMKEAGLLNRVLISHDAGWYDPMVPGGGNYRGYTDVFKFLLPALEAKGFTQQDIDQILEKNPQEAFMIRVRKL